MQEQSYLVLPVHVVFLVFAVVMQVSSTALWGCFLLSSTGFTPLEQSSRNSSGATTAAFCVNHDDSAFFFFARDLNA